MDALELWWCDVCQRYHFDEDVEAKQQEGKFVVVCKQMGSAVRIVDTWAAPAQEASPDGCQAQAMGELTHAHDA